MAIRGGTPRDNWNSGLYLDDQLWQQAMAADRRQAERRAAQDKFVWEERVLFHLIQQGIVDHDNNNKRWDGTTRVMHHTHWGQRGVYLAGTL